MAETPSNSGSLPAPAGAASSAGTGPKGKAQPPQQKTDLEVFLRYGLWNILKKNFDRILLVLVVIAAGVLVWNWKMGSNRAEEANAMTNASMAWEFLEYAQRSTGTLTSPNSGEEFVKQRLTIATEIENRVNLVMSSGAASPELKAKVLLVRGDLNYQLAQLPASAWPVVSGVTTKPSSDYLAAAEEAYRQILRDFPKMKAQTVPAALGLAAIEETRRNFKAAAEDYDLVINSPDARPFHKQLAKDRKAILKQLDVNYAPPSAASRAIDWTPTSAPTTLNLQPPDLNPGGLTTPPTLISPAGTQPTP